MMRHRWITDEDEDLGGERASEDIDQQESDSVRLLE